MDMDSLELESNSDSHRKLASIQIVEAIEPHPNADRLELITVLGWQVLEVKGALKTGDKIVYCEIDSMLPGTASWLPEAVQGRLKEQTDASWYRVKTIKLRGEISQGLIIPLTDAIVPFLSTLDLEGNVTKDLGIEKYEPAALSGKFANCKKESQGRPFPSHLLDKTEEIRVQSSPKLFKKLLGAPYYITVKMDGTSATFVTDPDTNEILVCSRNLVREVPKVIEDCPYYTIFAKYDIQQILHDYPDMAIQGEICGPNVQGNCAQLKDLQLFVFTVVNIRYRQRLSFTEMTEWCKLVKLPTAPIVEVGNEFQRSGGIKEIIAQAEGKYPNSKNQQEGLVFRSQNQSGSGAVSFKAINNLFLLEKNKKEDVQAAKK